MRRPAVWDRFWFSPGRAEDLAICRIIFCLGLWLLYARHETPLWTEVGPEFARPIKVLGVVSLVALPDPWLEVAWQVWRVCLLAGAAGLASRFSLAGAFGLGFYLLALPHHFGRLEHTDGLGVLLLGVLACSRCAERWSIDAWLRRGPGKLPSPDADEMYRWPIRMAQVMLAAVFCSAGLSKLINGGWAWVVSDTMSVILLKAQLSPTGVGPTTDAGQWLSQQRPLLVLAAMGTIVVELLYPLALFHRGARWLFPLAMVGLLVGIRVLVGPWFGTFILAHVFWVPWHRWSARWMATVNSAPHESATATGVAG